MNLHQEAQPTMSKYYSQIGQDQYFIENISKGKKNGLFLDIGANDGILDSNTAALELDYGWTGLCIEANPHLIGPLKTARPNSKVVNCAVWHSPGEIQLEVSGSNKDGVRGDLLSRVTNVVRKDDYFKEHFKEDSEIVTVKARTINDVVKEQYGFPCSFDYMSMDIEGAELQALKGIDFTQIEIKFMTIEHGGRAGYMEQIVKYLNDYGFKLHRVNQWDVELEKDPTKPIKKFVPQTQTGFARFWSWLSGKN
jgi:FkbM family methyltransferase